MYYNHHFMVMPWIWWIILIGIVLLIISNFIPWRPGRKPPKSRDDALDILKQRYARGEIDREEFEERLRVLREHTE